MYVAHLTKKTKLFQPAFTVSENNVFITDTKKGKKAFLKSGIRDVIFTRMWTKDKIFKDELIPMESENRNLELFFLPKLLEHIISLKKIRQPVNEIAVFSDKSAEIIPLCAPFCKMISLVGETGCGVMDGINLRGIKRIKNLPDIVVTDQKAGISPIFKVPHVHIGGRDAFENTLSVRTLCVKTEELPLNLSFFNLAYLMQTQPDIPFEVVSYRKKLPPLFTFG